MKPTKGYIYEIDGKVYVNPELNPKSNPAEEKIQHYWNRLSKWESNNIRVLNTETGNDGTKFFEFTDELGDLHPETFTQAQPCTYKISGDRAVVETLNT